MRIYKFGGASVKDAEGIRNLFSIMKQEGFDKTLLVVSAMGKTTNAFELVVKNYFENKNELQYSINQISKIKSKIVWTMHDMWPFCGAEHYTSDERYKRGNTKMTLMLKDR